MHYDWQRFWCPLGEPIYFADRGFLLDPCEEVGQQHHPDVVPLQTMDNVPCLICLGEPGLGKSVALRDYRDYRESVATTDGERDSFAVDLNRFRTDSGLMQSVFNSHQFDAWRNRGGILHLFLDSFDECLIRVDTLANLLVAELESLPLERLRLRIVSRTATWPSGLTARLKSLFGEDSAQAYELVPLRRRDVVTAAESQGVNAVAFLTEIDRRALAGLAMKPVTLRFLLKSFHRHGQFSSRQADLYHDGCTRLVEEANESRRGASLRGALSPSQRLTVAGRIASMTAYCGYHSVYTGLDDGDIPDGCLPIAALIGGMETADQQRFDVTESAIRETLDTGLFSARDDDTLGFAHQTYAEFLAATYIRDRGLTTEQILSLITHHNGEGQVVPQLQETAAWLATLLPAVFEHLVTCDPQALLGSDVATLGDESRANLVAALLRLFDEGRLIDDRHDQRQRYRWLAHLKLAEQLLPYITDKTKNAIVRRVAIDIAEACQIAALVEPLGNVALDSTDSHPTRVQAAYALARIGGDERRRLVPCVSGLAGEDPDDELKGVALRTLWPDHLTPAQVFSALSPPKRPSLHGSYSLFLYQCPESLAVADLPTALQWVAQQPHRYNDETALRRLIPPILLSAWRRSEESEVASVYAAIVAKRLQNYADVPGLVQASAADLDRRLALARRVLPLLAESGEPEPLSWSARPLFRNGDLPWLLEWITQISPGPLQTLLAQVILMRFLDGEDRCFDAILRAAETCPILRATFAQFIDPIDIHSEIADRLREYRRRHAELANPIPRPVGPPASERVRNCLDHFEKGNLDACWHLLQELTLAEEYATHYGDLLQPDIQSMPGWIAADGATRARILAAARRFLNEATPSATWVGTTTIDWRDFAGYRALYLLAKNEPAVLCSRQAEFWRGWAPVIAAYPQPSLDSQDRQEDLLARAYAEAPEQVLQALRVLIEAENRLQNYLMVHRRFERCADARLLEALMEMARDSVLKPTAQGELLDFLITHDHSEAIPFAISLVEDRHASVDCAERARVAARVLITRAGATSWPTIWGAIEQDNSFGREVLQDVAGQHDQEHTGACAVTMDESQIGCFYGWLFDNFPPDEDPEHDGIHRVTARDSIGYFRDAVLAHLKDRGTPAAVQAIKTLKSRFPQHSWLNWAAVQARQATVRDTWVPPSPIVLRQMVEQRQARIVESGEQLLEVLLESLGRLGHKLQAENPAAPDVWNEVSKGVFRPKDENALSDYITRHLRDDIGARGIVVNREVEIRRGEGDAKGERTDIQVSASTPSEGGSRPAVISVTIEVKGCWNKDLKKALGEQLRDRYLKDASCQHGLYLVGWYHCPQWDGKDLRVKATPKWTLEEARGFFDRQATSASTMTVSIKACVLDARLR